MSGIGSSEHRRAATGVRRLPPRSVLGRAGLVLALLMFGQLVLWPGNASAATINVTTTGRVHGNRGVLYTTAYDTVAAC